jgi:hypothetical protein
MTTWPASPKMMKRVAASVIDDATLQESMGRF